MKTGLGLIIENREIAQGIYRMLVKADNIDQPVLPGQFAHIKVPDDAHLLRRPISINTYASSEKTFSFIYQVKGEGTAKLSAKAHGGGIDLIAPLGKGFALPQTAKRVALVGGGIGVAPLLYAAQYWQKSAEFTAFIGFRTAALAYQIDDFKKVCKEVSVATDDGTLGYHGFAPQLLEREAEEFDIIMACGPVNMLRAVQKLSSDKAVPCQISLEERMGCGYGACLTCVCKHKQKQGDEWDYRRVCADGPVFDAAEVVL